MGVEEFHWNKKLLHSVQKVEGVIQVFDFYITDNGALNKELAKNFFN